MSEFALPPHLRGKLHNDWPWPFKNIPRGSNAYGLRCPKGDESYRPWPPRLMEGFGVARWELAGGQSIIEIPAFVDKRMKPEDIYGKTWMVIERNIGNPSFGKKFDITLQDPKEIWEVTTVTDVQIGDSWTQMIDPNIYSPSALQKFSPHGWMKLEPYYYSFWKVLKKRELPVYPETGEDTVIFYRTGYRPDHLDTYYNKSLIATGGLHWE